MNLESEFAKGISLESNPNENDSAQIVNVLKSGEVSSVDKEETIEQSSISSNTSNKVGECDANDYFQVVRPIGQMAEKLAKSLPYNIFLTCITSSPETHDEPLSITFQEILDPSLGELEESVQINFMVEAGWLISQYSSAGYIDKPLLILYGRSSELETVSKNYPNISAHKIKMRNSFDTHHSKIMLLGYTDGSMRVVIATANLCPDEWDNIAEGLWMSDTLEPLDEESATEAGESSTEFRKDLLTYLLSYKLPELEPWLKRIQRTNFRSVNVFLVTSIPGVYINKFPHGHRHVGQLLLKHSAPIPEDSNIVAQVSSLGIYGGSLAAWVGNDIINSFRHDSQSSSWRDQRKQPNICIIYPSYKNVKDSYDGLSGGGYLGYQRQFHEKQLWLNRYLYQWRADCRYRSKAVPHIKTYCRWSEKKLYWFMLTSANLSKAAWGSATREKFYNRNYEAGVVFFPKFVTNTTYFSMDEADKSTPVFPQLYDIPLTTYGRFDRPFFMDDLYGEN